MRALLPRNLQDRSKHRIIPGRAYPMLLARKMCGSCSGSMSASFLICDASTSRVDRGYLGEPQLAIT
jgi:hypothetical protein